MKRVACLLVLCCVLNAAWSAKLARKQLAGPPSEFEAHRLPVPEGGALVEGSALFRPNFATYVKQNQLGADSTVVYEQKLLVDSDSKFMFSFFSPYSKELKLALADPNGRQINLAGHAHKVRSTLTLIAFCSFVCMLHVIVLAKIDRAHAILNRIPFLSVCPTCLVPPTCSTNLLLANTP